MSVEPTVIKHTTRLARKEHKCCECGTKIVKGMHYDYTSGIWDGEPRSFKQCVECSILFQQITSYCYSDQHFGGGECSPCFEWMESWLYEEASAWDMHPESDEFIDQFINHAGINKDLLTGFYWRKDKVRQHK